MAKFINKKSAEIPTSENNKLFETSIDMLIDEEMTTNELKEQKSNNSNEKLSDLSKEDNVPLKKLLALCGYPEADENKIQTDKNFDQIEPMEEDHPDTSTKIQAKHNQNQKQDASRRLRSVSQMSEGDDEEYDDDSEGYEWRKVNKTIMVGSDYQAIVPEGLCHYDDTEPYEDKDKLLWNPDHLELDTIEDFLRKAASLAQPAIPLGIQVRDDEQALYLSQQCGYNVDEALRRLSITVVPDSDNPNLWSEEECRNFESGVRCYGKNFRLIQQNKVRTRSIGELVQFYYLWKKTERHDIFANKNRLEKKKYTLHPGLTDFMDRFLEDNEDRDRSSSPTVYICTTDSKRPSISNLNPKPPP